VVALLFLFTVLLQNVRKHSVTVARFVARNLPEPSGKRNCAENCSEGFPALRRTNCGKGFPNIPIRVTRRRVLLYKSGEAKASRQGLMLDFATIFLKLSHVAGRVQSAYSQLSPNGLFVGNTAEMDPMCRDSNSASGLAIIAKSPVRRLPVRALPATR
jgi:hypothetical protein